MADLGVTQRVQSRRTERQSAAADGHRRVPQRAIWTADDMLISRLALQLRRRLQRLAHDQRGVSAVEFAMLLPLMLTLYLGAVEISQAVAVDRKVTLAARSVADLVAQVTTVNNADV